MLTATGSRPCPVCDATGTDYDGSHCRACEGTRWFPYPWRQTGDEEIARGYQNWTIEESAIVTTAPSQPCAVIGYYAVYGPTRSASSIQSHRLRVLKDPRKRPIWNEAALEIVSECPSSGSAADEVLRRFPDLPLNRGQITAKWWYMNGSETR